ERAGDVARRGSERRAAYVQPRSRAPARSAGEEDVRRQRGRRPGRDPGIEAVPHVPQDGVSGRARRRARLARNARVSDDLRGPAGVKLTVSMITLNEERAVAKVVEEIRRVAPDAEIFLVDSSRDRTAEIAQVLGCR